MNQEVGHTSIATTYQWMAVNIAKADMSTHEYCTVSMHESNVCTCEHSTDVPNAVY
jgi:hypothetical protein